MKYKLKQKQNQRITRITEQTLVVGADIAKETHVARAIDFRGIELGKDCVFHNDREGLIETGNVDEGLAAGNMPRPTSCLALSPLDTTGFH